jgi:hypothetical protein
MHRSSLLPQLLFFEKILVQDFRIRYLMLYITTVRITTKWSYQQRPLVQCLQSRGVETYSQQCSGPLVFLSLPT